MRRQSKTSEQVLACAADTLEASPAELVFFGSAQAGRYYANGGVSISLPSSAMGAVVPPDRGLARDELLECVREAQRQHRRFDLRVAAAFCFLPPLPEAGGGLVRPGLFVHDDVGPETVESFLRQALAAIDPAAPETLCGVKPLSDALSRAAPGELFFGQPSGHPGLNGFWPQAWATQTPPATEVEALGRCVLVAREGEPAEPSENLLSPEMV